MKKPAVLIEYATAQQRSSRSHMEFMSWAEAMMAVRKLGKCVRKNATSFVLNKQIYQLKSGLIYPSVVLNRQVNKNQAEAPHGSLTQYSARCRP